MYFAIVLELRIFVATETAISRTILDCWNSHEAWRPYLVGRHDGRIKIERLLQATYKAFDPKKNSLDGGECTRRCANFGHPVGNKPVSHK